MLQLSPVPAASFLDRLRAGAGRRTLAIGLALLIEAILFLLLLSLSAEQQPGTKDGSITVVDVSDDTTPAKAPEQSSPEPEQAAAERPAPHPQKTEPAPPSATPQPLPPQPAEPKPLPPTPAIVPAPQLPAAPSKSARPSGPKRVYGPPNTGRPSSSRDSEVVGTAPNGEPLYAAEWYQEPRPGDLRGYMSTAHGPGWGLIACRTASEYRVEACVPIAEYPEGSQINRAVLAAAWEFKVRPPRLGGKSLVGSWVRIRIDYSIQRR